MLNGVFEGSISSLLADHAADQEAVREEDADLSMAAASAEGEATEVEDQEQDSALFQRPRGREDLLQQRDLDSTHMEIG